MSNFEPILLTGCTASGKSELAKNLSKLTPSVIINADALQVYDCWKILTARPTEIDVKNSHHALYGHISYLKNYDVAKWLTELKSELSNAKEKNLRPIIVGGTGLYFTMLVNGISKIPSISELTRQKANQIMKTNPSQFTNDLKTWDKNSYGKLDPDNYVRLQRAWEVCYETGETLLYWQSKSLPPLLNFKSTKSIILSCKSSYLEKNIKTRFKKMLAMGLTNEVAFAVNRLPSKVDELAAFRAIGVKEIISYLKGELSLVEVESLMTTKTRQYAKRQRTWFRSKFYDWKTTNIDEGTDLMKTAQDIDNMKIN